MDKMNRCVRGYFAWALGLSIGFPVGVLCIIFGAIKGVTIMLVAGIILALAGFYVMPLLWIKYGERRKFRTILRFILEEHIYTVQGLSAQAGCTEKRMRYIINYLVLANYLTGFLIDGDTLVLNSNKKQSSRTAETKKCTNCGGKMIFDGLKFVCDYCGSTEKR